MTDEYGSDESSWWLGRDGIVHLVQPGHADPAAAMDRSLGAPLMRIIEETFEDCPNVEQIEVLVVPTKTGYTCCLHAHSSTTTRTQAPVPAAHRTTGMLVDAAKRHLPGLFGIETGSLWLQPLAPAHAVTGRAIETTTRWSLTNTRQPFHVMNTWTASRRRGPLVYQLLIRPHQDTTYPVTLRAMQLGQRPPTDAAALGALLEEGVPSPLDVGLPADVTSARRLADNHWETVPVARASGGPDAVRPTIGYVPETDGYPPSAALHARECLTTAHETRGFLAAREHTTPYTGLDGAPRLSATAADLQRLLDVFPLPTDTSWRATMGRSPRLARTAVEQPPTGTDSDSLLPTPPEGWPAATPEQAFLRTATGWLSPGDHEPDTLSAPIGGSHATAPTTAGVVVVADQAAGISDAPIGTPGGLVSVANHAVTAGEPLWVLTADAATSQWVHRTLHTPWRTTHTKTSEPYDLPDVWALDDNRIPLEDTTTQTAWLVAPTNEWGVHVDGDVRAHGHLDALTTPTVFELPYLEQTSDGFAHVTTTGDVCATYPALTAVADPWRPIKQPVIPQWPTFADYATVLEYDSMTFRPVWPTPPWLPHTDPHRILRYYPDAARKFVDTHTIPRVSSAPPATGVNHWLSRYYQGHADYALNAPNRNRLADILDSPVKETSDGITLPERAWAIPPQTDPATTHPQSDSHGN
ncbi:hypothetical protein [Halobacterium salinarum]|uniref:Uncharacterized protein n=1 Tax=Halobacterium salinarum (strain ATCC 33171 / DSM 3754 / JCM 8978 / NBRC 102687 / NCIMB 764 / 91-R6) TaxID=2597657 RepID=A0A4D6GS80_HALS9|nr:hypothetical protein [Halobacterium salinarum]MDL0124174.1 hypothetical protein [Halobacterium salinarum]QCC43986.1 uncharacterized protein HBSAL_01225 [Halobacterium salinarum]TYO82480.1 hypothetical protein APQ99_01011 [Halobacterium salinarum DSM 3754]